MSHKSLNDRDSYRYAVADAVPGVTLRSEPGVSVIAMVPCQACGQDVEAFRAIRAIPPAMVRKKIIQKGWRLGNTARKHICPNHQQEKPMPANDVKPALRTVISNPSVRQMPAVLEAGKPTPDAKAARRDCLRWLDEAFEPGSGTYKAGVTDETIAKDTGLAVAAVAELREEFYGPLNNPVPPEVVEAMAELRRVEADTAKLHRDVIEKLEQLRTRTAAVSDRITALIKTNGWR